jgi:hypothetical protein
MHQCHHLLHEFSSHTDRPGPLLGESTLMPYRHDEGEGPNRIKFGNSIATSVVASTPGSTNT